MYPVSKGFTSAVQQVQTLLDEGHVSEALLASVFVSEKTFRRVIRFLIVSSGFKSTIAEKLINRIRGLEQIKQHWDFYDPQHRNLTAVISLNDWGPIKSSSQVRNQIVHGIRVYKRSVLAEETINTLAAITSVEQTFQDEYGYGGWTTQKIRRVSRLHIDPYVKQPHIKKCGS